MNVLKCRPQSLTRWAGPLCAASTVVLFAVVFIGCGGTGSGSAGSSDQAHLVIDLEGVSYLWRLSSGRPLDGFYGGLYPLGDINGDGCTDFVIAASRQEGTGRVDRGWIEAYSGSDGLLLWQVSGKGEDEAKSAGDEHAFHLKEISVIGDVNGDEIPDIYCREGWYESTALLFSGRDGQRLGRYAIDKTDYLRRPFCWQDVDDDGVDDLIFSAYSKDSLPAIQTLSGVDFSPLGERDDVWPEADTSSAEWLLPRFPDVDGDGVTDCLLRRGLPQSNTDPVYTFEFALLSGKDFSMIRTFETARPRIGGKTHHVAAGDLNADGVEDILMTSSTGDGSQNYSSSLRAISGHDGAVLWQVLGTQLKGGRVSTLIDVKTSEKTVLERDVEFDAPVVATPDLNGDTVNDVATLAFEPGGNGSRKAVLIFSGTDGQPLATLQLTKQQGNLSKSIILLQSATEDRRPAVVVDGRARDGKSLLAIFVLPDLR